MMPNPIDSFIDFLNGKSFAFAMLNPKTREFLCIVGILGTFDSRMMSMVKVGGSSHAPCPPDKEP